ncbi:hypothetical protein HpKG90_13850 [Helicobacter pylori]
MAVRFGVIFITDFMVFTNESDTVFNSIIELFAIKKEQGN